MEIMTKEYSDSQPQYAMKRKKMNVTIECTLRWNVVCYALNVKYGFNGLILTTNICQ